MLTMKKIPNFSNYGITESGELFNLNTNRRLKTSPDVRGYHNTALVNDDGVRLTVKRHRLVALTHLPLPPGDIKDFVVNHIDGIPGNDCKDNLEWVTQKENVNHFWSNPDNKRTKFKLETYDVNTKAIIKYNSISECSKALNIERYSIHIRLRRGPEYIWPEGVCYRLGHSDDPWPEVKHFSHGRSRDVIIKDLTTGKSYIYKKLSDVIPFVGFKLSTIWKWAVDASQPVIPGLYQIQFYDKKTKPWREVNDILGELQEGCKGKVVLTYDSDWSNAIWYSTAKECAVASNLNVTCLNYRLKSKGRVIYNDNKRYCYYDDLTDVQKKTIRYEVPLCGDVFNGHRKLRPGIPESMTSV